ALVVDGRVPIRVQGGDGDVEGAARRDIRWSGEGEVDRGPRRSEVQSDANWVIQPCDQDFLPAAVKVGASNVPVTGIGPVHLAASQIKSSTAGRLQVLDEDFLAGAVEVGPPDVAPIKMGPVHLAARNIESNSNMLAKLPRDEGRQPGAVEVGPPDASAT